MDTNRLSKITLRLGVIYASQESKTPNNKLKKMHESIIREMNSAREAKHQAIIIVDLC